MAITMMIGIQCGILGRVTLICLAKKKKNITFMSYRVKISILAYKEFGDIQGL